MLRAQRRLLCSSGSLPRVLHGAWRRPHNDLREQHVGGGHKAIHDDETAAAVGFAQAPIHGTVHWSAFTPLLLEAFGQAWFETGHLSTHFVNTCSHLEPVRASLQACNGQAADISMEHVDGRIVLEGTAGIGPCAGETMVDRRIALAKPVAGALVFVRAPVGARTLEPERARIDWGRPVGPYFPFTLERKLETITEFSPWFADTDLALPHASPWGRPVLPPEALNMLMLGRVGKAKEARWPEAEEDAWLREAVGARTPVALLGACEVVLRKGPVCPGVEYEVVRELVGKGETRATEYAWVRTELREAGSDDLIATMTVQKLMLKASFKGYAELRACCDERA